MESEISAFIALKEQYIAIIVQFFPDTVVLKVSKSS